MTRSGDYISLCFGATCQPLIKQLRSIGVVLSKAQRAQVMYVWQADADAITMLSVRGFLSESARHIARRKLMRRIRQGLR